MAELHRSVRVWGARSSLKLKHYWSNLILIKIRNLRVERLTGFFETLRPSASGFSPALFHSSVPCHVAWFIIELLLSQKSATIRNIALDLALGGGGYSIHLKSRTGNLQHSGSFLEP
ncbi:hypothetical protein M758_10G168500 [Ceratodon purpureus]|nr:hypothetical protein M758_10G168500 [Ceratodon purpureus]